MSIQVLRGTTINREAITPLIAEIVYDITTKQLYVGDGATLGGVQVGGSGDVSSVFGETGDVSLADFSDTGTFTTGTKIVVYNAGDGHFRIDYDDLPGAASGLSDAYTAITGDSGSSTASGADTLQLFGATNGGITTVSSSAPDRTTFRVDIADMLLTTPILIDADNIPVSDGGTSVRVALTTLVDYLDGKYLNLGNTEVFTPDADYEPATKKYVDDNAVGNLVTSVFGDTGDVTITGLNALLSPVGADSVAAWDSVSIRHAEVTLSAFPISDATQTALNLKVDDTEMTDYFHKTNDDADDLTDGITNVIMLATERTHLTGIEIGAEVNNISDINATDLTDAGDSTLHYHVADRVRANHTGTQLAITISDFEAEVANNADVAANTAAQVPAGGLLGYVLKKDSATDYDMVWGAADAAANGLPVGGTITQLLSKASATDYDAEWIDPPAGGGDVVGPASAVDSNLAAFNTTTGKLIKDSLITMASVSAAISKLAGIDSGATDDQTGAEIKALYEVETNAFTDTLFTKLDGIDTGATDDQTGAEIKALYELELNAFTDTLFTKLNGIAEGAEVNLVDSVFGRDGVVVAVTNDYTWAQVDKTTSDITGITTRNHNDLQNIQGGAVADYYHITGAQRTALIGGADTGLHYHLVDRSRANHTGTQLAATISDLTAAITAHSDLDANTPHRDSDGTVHGYINQDVQSTAAPSFAGMTLTADATITGYHLKGLEEAIEVGFDGGGSAIAADTQIMLEVKTDMTVQSWTIVADVAGAIVIDVDRGTYTAFPTVASITGTGTPTIAATNQKATGVVTLWGSTALVKGDILVFNVDSCTTIEKATISLKCVRA